jgi:hydrogenase expression/formation protein HypE
MPIVDSDEVLMGHGSGGKLTARLIERMILPAFGNPELDVLDDAAALDLAVPAGGRLAFTTDSYVVTPIFSPGGDSGARAVNATVTHRARVGARPRVLSLAFILEEGFAIAELARVIESARRAAVRAGVSVVTGDTKVVGRGSGDKVFINTSGIGVVPPGIAVSSARVAPGDAILLSGTVGDHGITILTQREGLELDGALASDTAPLHELTAAMFAAHADIHALRDPTRGGVAATLVEIASRRKLGVAIDERAVPVRDTVRGACEILGLDPLLVANEGKLVAFVPEDGAARVLAAMRAHPLGRDAARIGTVTAAHPGFVTVRTPIGGERILDLPFGESLPRIC